MTKKMLKIKKKLVSLEMERCQKKIEHKDVTKTDQKIAELKQQFETCCQER
jgi:lipid II:glycine glycyltransferase (peptidoglycan interpeptide bridge formation enzyme)